MYLKIQLSPKSNNIHYLYMKTVNISEYNESWVFLNISDTINNESHS